MSVGRYIERITTGDRTPLMSQLPTAGAFVLAFATCPTPMVPVTSRVWIVVAFVFIAIATAASAWVSWDRLPRSAVYLVPLLSMVAVASLRLGTGGTSSPYGTLILLPFVWLAIEEGRLSPVLAAVGASTVTLAPVLVTQEDVVLGVVRAVFASVIYTTVALVLHAIGARLRRQLDQARSAERVRAKLHEQAVSDAAELRMRQSELVEANRLITEVWNSVTEQSIIATDLTGKIQSWNPGATKLLGMGEDEVLAQGAGVTEFHSLDELQTRACDEGADGAIATADGQELSALVKDVRDGGSEVSDWTYVRADGGTLPVQVTVTPRRDGAGEVVGYIFVATDMTRVRELARLKDDFVGLVSHELRTPLSSILGYLDLLRDDSGDGLTDEQRRYVGVIDRNALRLLSLVGDLLFAAQVEAGGFPVEFERCDVGELVRAAQQSAAPAAHGRGIDVRIELPERPLLLDADRTRLAQAIDNLVSNALKFSTAEGSVTIAAREIGDVLELSIADTGIGIPANELDQLAKRFYRASTATTHQVPGIGLGLAITKAIVTAHHGQLGIESELGRGTTFTITLPMRQSAAAHRSLEATSA